MKRIEVSILAILALLSLLLGIALVQEKQATRNLKINLELTKQELQDTQGDRDYYQGQYKKYFELSEEFIYWIIQLILKQKNLLTQIVLGS